MRSILLTGLGVAAGAVLYALIARLVRARPDDAPFGGDRTIRTTIPWGTPVIGQA